MNEWTFILVPASPALVQLYAQKGEGVPGNPYRRVLLRQFDAKDPEYMAGRLRSIRDQVAASDQVDKSFWHLRNFRDGVWEDIKVPFDVLEDLAQQTDHMCFSALAEHIREVTLIMNGINRRVKPTAS